jgi:alkaline phosphatase D
MRLAVLSLLGLLGLVLLAFQAGGESSASSTCSSSPDVVTQGPRVGEVTEDSAKVWLRTCVSASVNLQYKLSSEDWSGALETAPVATSPVDDYTAVLSIDGLQSEAAYDYRIEVDDQLPTKGPGGSFATVPAPGGGGSTFSFLVSSDSHHPSVLPTTILSNMAQQDVLFALLGGDQIEIERVLLNLGHCCIPESLSDYEVAYQGILAYQPLVNFLSNTPTLVMWDDHEILNDWNQGTAASPYPWARTAFDRYIGSANPDPRSVGELNFVYRAGDVEIYVVDTRSYRSPGLMPDGPEKTMLGADQKADLKDWLLTSTARFKLIASSVMWNEFSNHISSGESWPAYNVERSEILSFIADNQIPGVVLISGDEHWAGVFHLAPWGIYEIAPAPMTVGVHGPSPLTDPQVLFASGNSPQNQFGSFFGLFNVDTTVCPAELTIQIMNINGNVRYTLPLTEMDLHGDLDGDTLPMCQESEIGTDPDDPDTDGDACGDGREIGSSHVSGGERDPLDPWDYFNPSGDGFNRIDDVVLVLQQYFIDQGNPAYTEGTDRTIGPTSWRSGPPNGLQRIDDVLVMLGSYFDDCPVVS